MIELQHVTRLYGTVIGVNDITVSLPQGAYGLLGPNGSGKSTLLNLITGQLRSTLGAVRVMRLRPWNNAQLFRRIGVCPEHEALYTNVSGFEWVRYLLRLQGFGRRESKRRAEQSLASVGLQDAMRRRMSGYSRGMRQRVKLAQAMAHDPELLILDEPFNGVDPIGRRQITDLLRQWIRSGKGLVLASHLLHEVEAVTDSFLLICNGRLLASGKAEEVHELLGDLPSEIRIRSSDRVRLARRLVAEEGVQAVRYEADEDVLVVATRSPAAIYSGLPAWAAESGVSIYEMQSDNGSLQTLFDRLLQIHRGLV